VDDNGHRKARVTSISTDKDVVQKVKDQLATLPEAGEEQVVADSVSASFGSQISRKAFQALLIFLVLFAVAASLRFEWKMAVAALVALIHDLLITAGVYSIVGFEVVPATVIATLTILGYSLYDTIVVFDKIQENTALAAQAARQSYSETANDSLNHVMMRSINTSLFSLLPVGSLLVVGLISIAGGTLKDFALALFVGLLSGAYSSIFVATPVLALLKEREPRYQAIRARVETRAVRSRPGRIEGRPVVVVEEEDIEAAVEAAAAVADDEAVAAAPRPAAKKGAPAAKKGTQARRPAAKGRPSGSRKKKRR
jgi:preprotein translocase subunit SecF